MKKVLLSAVILTQFILCAKAQKASVDADKDFKFSIGVIGALPTGDLKSTSNFGIGGSLQGEYKAAPELGLTVSVDYISFSGKNYSDLGTTIKYPTISLIPILAGGRYYFGGGAYISAQLGITSLKASGESSTSAFTYAPGIGYYLSPNFDLLLKYQAASKNGGTIAFIGLRAAYNF